MRISALIIILYSLVSCRNETVKKESTHTHMTKDNRIWFTGNPWKEGHPIKKFEWSAEIRDGVVWFHLHLETEDYEKEKIIDDPEDTDYDSDWEAPIVWNNYHSCTISSNNWHDGGFPVCSVDEYSIEKLDGFIANVDPLPVTLNGDLDDLAFHTYLLGHDSVAGHEIKFVRREGTELFDIHWDGKIALVYAGDEEYRYEFHAQILQSKAPKIKMQNKTE